LVSVRTVARPLAIAVVLPLALAGCGSDKKSSTTSKPSSRSGQATTLAISITDAGKSTKYSAPSTVKGGLVALRVTNNAKAPHGAQVVRLGGQHQPQDVFKVFAGPSGKIPAWLRFEGGLGSVLPGKTASATVNLPAGRYAVADSGGPGQSGPPSFAQFTVTAGKAGPLPSTTTTITAANPGKDKYRWDVSGPLQTGTHSVTFDSKGKSALHFFGAFRLNGNPSKAEIIKALNSNGKPPSFVDQANSDTTPVLDGGKSQVTPFVFKAPGRYVLFCPLKDRDGGKPHFQEGLLRVITIK
jgi:hypothetical protein